MNAFDQLVAIWPPPNPPAGSCNEADWGRASASLPVLPPLDYRRFLEVYGTGYVGINDIDPHWLVLRSPARANGYAELVEGFQASTRQLNECKRVSAKSFPFPVLPETGGLFPFAHDSCGFEYYWLTQGAPEDWKVFLDPDLGELENLGISFSELMLSFVQGRPAHKDFSDIEPATVIWTRERPEDLR